MIVKFVKYRRKLEKQQPIIIRELNIDIIPPVGSLITGYGKPTTVKEIIFDLLTTEYTIIVW
jgi:hypothetical protein